MAGEFNCACGDGNGECGGDGLLEDQDARGSHQLSGEGEDRAVTASACDDASGGRGCGGGRRRDLLERGGESGGGERSRAQFGAEARKCAGETLAGGFDGDAKLLGGIGHGSSLEVVNGEDRAIGPAEAVEGGFDRGGLVLEAIAVARGAGRVSACGGGALVPAAASFSAEGTDGCPQRRLVKPGGEGAAGFEAAGAAGEGDENGLGDVLRQVAPARATMCGLENHVCVAGDEAGERVLGALGGVSLEERPVVGMVGLVMHLAI